MPEYYTRELELSIKVFCRITLASTCEGNFSTYSQTSIIRGTLASKTSDNRGPRIIEVQIIEV